MGKENMEYYDLKNLMETLKYYASSQTRLVNIQNSLILGEKQSDFFVDKKYISKNTLIKIIMEYFVTPTKTVANIQKKFYSLGYSIVFQKDILRKKHYEKKNQ